MAVRISETTEALEAWRQAVRELDATSPWTADWLRARMIEEDRRVAYQALAHDHEGAESTDTDSLPAGVDT
jgi:hypothetical protein